MNPFNLFDFSFFLLLKPVRNHKLEKADILEMTVKHLRNLQKQKLASKLKFDFKNLYFPLTPPILKKFNLLYFSNYFKTLL
jgi:hypothetical protein